MKPIVTDSKTIFQGKVFDVRRDRAQFNNGHETNLDVIVHGGAVAMLPIDKLGRIWLVRQYRHPIEQNLLEIPAGSLEAGETPAHCAVRECQEEIGMQPQQLTYMGFCYLAAGYSSEKIHLFLVQELVSAPLPGDEDEQIEIEKYTLEEIEALIQSNELVDAKTIVAIHRALPRLQAARRQVLAKIQK